MPSNNVVKPLRRDEVENSVAVLARDPFETLLVKFILASPTQKAIKEFAQKYPDRWGQALTILSKLRGYTERVEHDVTINIRSRLNAMGDAELMAYHEKLKSQLVDPHQKFLKKPIEGEVVKDPTSVGS